MSTSSPLTPGETPSCVVMSPKTIQGCLPISVKTQPMMLAASARGNDQIASFHIHCAGGFLAPLRVSHRPTTATRAAAMPRPIIQRNAQYVTQRIGANSVSPVSANVVLYSALRSLMPCTQASNEWVDSSESKYGTRIENSSELPSGVPSVKMLKEAS